MQTKRIIQFALSGIVRNMYLSFSAILLIGATLFICNIVLSIHLIAKETLHEIQKKVDIVFYLKDDAEPIRVSELTSEITKLSSVKEITITTKEDALRQMTVRFPQIAAPFKKYNLENPLPAHMSIITSDTKNHEQIMEIAKSDFFSDLLLTTSETDENEELVVKLLHMTDTTTKILISTILLFLMTSALIVINTVSSSMYGKKEELKIIKLVGGGKPYLIYPFLVEGVFYGISGFVLSILLLGIFLERTGLDLITMHLNGSITPYLLFEFLLCILVGASASLVVISKFAHEKK